MGKRNDKTGQNMVLAHMQNHPGMVYSGMTLAAEVFDQPTEYEAGRITASMGTLATKGLIERVAMGKYLWRKSPAKVEPPKNVTGDLFERIGTRKSTGNVIVKDVDNNLYELHEL